MSKTTRRPVDPVEIVGTVPVYSKFVCLCFLGFHRSSPSVATMSRAATTYTRLPVTTDDVVPPDSKNGHHLFFESARAKRARRTLSFTILGAFIAVFLVLSLGSLPGRLPFQPTTEEVDPQGKGECLRLPTTLTVGLILLRQNTTQTFQSTLGCVPSPRMTSDWMKMDGGSSSSATSTV